MKYWLPVFIVIELILACLYGAGAVLVFGFVFVFVLVIWSEAADFLSKHKQPPTEEHKEPKDYWGTID